MNVFCIVVCCVVVVFISLYVLWFLGVCVLVSLRSSQLKRRSIKHDDSGTDKEESPKVNKKNSKLKTIFLEGFYEGIYRWLVFKTANIPSRSTRMFIYKHIFKMTIGKGVKIYKGLEIRGAYRISIGDGTVIGDDTLLDGRGGLAIGKNVNFSSHAQIYTQQHDYNDPDFKGIDAAVVIHDRAWISSETIVLPGVTIGEGAVLASGALANKDLEEFSVYVGVPARKIKDRSMQLNYDFSKCYGPWLS